MKNKIKWLMNATMIMGLMIATILPIDAKEITVNRATVIVNKELIILSNITIWQAILEGNNGNAIRFSREFFSNDLDDKELIKQIVDIHLLAGEAAKRIEAREKPEMGFVEKIAYWSQPSFWLNSALKNIKKDKESLSVKKNKEEKLIAELLGTHRDPGWMKIKKFIRENAARLGISGDLLRNYLVKLSLAKKCREFWKEDIKNTSYVSPNEAREYYKTHILDFQTFRHVVFSEKGFGGDMAKTEKIVEEICVALDKGVSFENLGIDNFQEFPRAAIDDFMPVIRELTLGLSQLDNVKKVGWEKSDLGWHIIQLQPPKSFQEAQEEIFKKLEIEKREAAMQKLLQKLRRDAAIVFLKN